MENATASFGAMSACAHCGAPFTPVVGGQTLCDKCQGLAHPEPASPLQQAEVAGFRLVRELGAGRFSHSWLAEDAQGVAVVLKFLRRYAPDPNAVQRFLAEAQRLAAASELDHPNVARPLAGGVHLVQAFFLVYQGGGEVTLADELRQRGRVLPGRALELCAQVAEGLASAHRGGVLHRDLKPANVGLTRTSGGTEQAVVLDVATSHLLVKAGLPDVAPLPLSTAAYVSPEEAAGKPPDERSDLYSAGVLLFQLVTGRLPIMGGTADELLRAHREQPPLRLRDVGRRVSSELEELLARLLSKDPAQRPESGDELAVMMRAIIPVADTAPMEDGPEGVEDPLPVVEAPRPEPEVMPPPQMLPPPVDPALERAMMGEVPEPAPEKAPGIPRWVAFVPPRWWPLAAGAALLLAIAAVLLARGDKRAPATRPPAVAAASPAAAPAAPAAHSPAAQVPAPEPAQQPHRAAPVPGPYAKQLDRAQKALWIGQASVARGILRDLLRKPLSRHDRARASKMMGDAEAKKGRRAAAAGWYRKAARLSDDPGERARVEKLLAGAR